MNFLNMAHWITFKSTDIKNLQYSYAPHCDQWVQVLISTTLCPAENTPDI